MSNIPYSGGTVVNTTFTTTTGTRLEIVAGLETQLVTAGWSVISGAGTGTVILKSATTTAPKSNSIRVRLFDPGSGNCAQIRIQDDSGTYVSQIFYLLPAASKVFRVVACKYNFFVCTAQPSAAREIVCGGTLHIPDFLEGSTTGSLGWMHGNAQSDVDTAIGLSFRTRLTMNQNSDTAAYASSIRNNTVTNCTMNNNSANHTLLPSWYTQSTQGTQWSDGTFCTHEAILGFGSGSASATNYWQGMIHNTMIVSKVFAGEDLSVVNYDSHAWVSFTHNNNTNSGWTNTPIGTLLLAIT